MSFTRNAVYVVIVTIALPVLGGLKVLSNVSKEVLDFVAIALPVLGGLKGKRALLYCIATKERMHKTLGVG